MLSIGLPLIRPVNSIKLNNQNTMLPEEEREQKEEECMDLVNKASDILNDAFCAHNKTERKKLEKQAEDLIKKAEEIIEKISEDGMEDE